MNSEYVPAKKQLSSPNLGLPQAHLPRDFSAIRVSTVTPAGTEYPIATFLRCLVVLSASCPLSVVKSALHDIFTRQSSTYVDIQIAASTQINVMNVNATKKKNCCRNAERNI